MFGGGNRIGGDEADESNFSVVVMAITSDLFRGGTNGLATGLSADSRCRPAGRRHPLPR